MGCESRKGPFKTLTVTIAVSQARWYCRFHFSPGDAWTHIELFELSNLLLNVSLTRRPLSKRGQPRLGRTAERQASLVAMLATTQQ